MLSVTAYYVHMKHEVTTTREDRHIIKTRGDWFTVGTCSCGFSYASRSSARVTTAVELHEVASGIQAIVDTLCEQHSLAPIVVSVDAKMSRTLGQARLHERVMRINPNLLGNIAMLDNTIRHEAAHFFAYDNFGCPDHGDAWIHACAITGAKPEQYSHVVAGDEESIAAHGFRYKYTCAKGCVVHTRKPRPTLTNGRRVCTAHRLKFELIAESKTGRF